MKSNPLKQKKNKSLSIDNKIKLLEDVYKKVLHKKEIALKNRAQVEKAAT